MKRITLVILCGLLQISVYLQAYANDSLARVGAGGLTLLKATDIKMVQETLEISQTKIRVHYRFLNESKQDIKTTVAFPMPPYGFNPGFSAGEENEKPLEDFHVWVDGKELQTKTDRVATFSGMDVTDKLRKIGLSDKQIFETFGDCDVDSEKMSVKCGLTESQEAEINKLNDQRHNGSRWKVAETAYWEQVFPAGKEIEVIHEYPPFVGMIYNVPYQKGHGDNGYINKDFGTPIAIKEKNIADICLDKSTQDLISRRVKSIADKGANWVTVGLHDVEYILGTGRNWKGPIKDFKLIIKKDSPDEIVSLCFPGKPKRTSPLTIEFSQVDFIPKDELVIYFYSIVKSL